MKMIRDIRDSTSSVAMVLSPKRKTACRNTSVPQSSNFLKVKNCACEFVTKPDDDPDPELDDPDEVSVDAAGPLTTTPDGGPPVETF